MAHSLSHVMSSHVSYVYVLIAHTCPCHAGARVRRAPCCHAQPQLRLSAYGRASYVRTSYGSHRLSQVAKVSARCPLLALFALSLLPAAPTYLLRLRRRSQLPAGCASITHTSACRRREVGVRAGFRFPGLFALRPRHTAHTLASCNRNSEPSRIGSI
jgi:hypothetical protein